MAAVTVALLVMPEVATGAGRTAPSSPGGRRFALTPLIGRGLAAATGFVVQQRRSSG